MHMSCHSLVAKPQRAFGFVQLSRLAQDVHCCALRRAHLPSKTLHALGTMASSWQPSTVRTRSAVAAATAGAVTARHELTCGVGDVIQGKASDGSDVFLEVLAAEPGQPLKLASKGVLWVSNISSDSMQGSSNMVLELQPQGWQLNREDALIRAFPGWGVALAAAQEAATLPSAMTLHAPAVVASAAKLEAAVLQDPSSWRDGTASGDPQLTGLQYQLLCAGEIASLLAGSRGVVMVQLQVAWDKSSPQPVLNPLALHMLRKALLRPDLSIFISKAPGAFGLTAILAAKVEPYRSWAAHLATFGAQAALVADSPYYKLLIGRVMGYKEANVIHHIQTTSGRMHPSSEVVSAVTLNMGKLSRAQPQLPWTQEQAQQQGSRRGSRGKRASHEVVL